MTTRLQQAFKTLRETGRKGVVPYITAGDPDSGDHLRIAGRHGTRRSHRHRTRRPFQRSGGRRPGDSARLRARTGARRQAERRHRSCSPRRQPPPAFPSCSSAISILCCATALKNWRRTRPMPVLPECWSPIFRQSRRKVFLSRCRAVAWIWFRWSRPLRPSSASRRSPNMRQVFSTPFRSPELPARGSS